jgi:hypothetical protein
MKDKLLKTIEKAYHNTKNSAKKITLANYYNTVQEQDEASIDHEWYYKQLKSFGFLKTSHLKIQALDK